MNCNVNGHFLELTRFQRLLRENVGIVLNIELIRSVLEFSRSNSLRGKGSFSLLTHFLMKKDSCCEMYRYLLSNETSALSDSGRNGYRNNLILLVLDLALASLLLPLLLEISFHPVKRVFFDGFCIEFLENYLDWLMGWPAGFKFNANLTKFLGKLFLSMMALWRGKCVIIFVVVFILFSSF